MLEPLTGVWHVHYTLCPHQGYPEVPYSVLKAAAAAASDKPSILTQACLAMLRKAATAYVRQLRSGRISVTLWGGNALRLCVTQLAGRTFDIIETSNIGDHVGLLNLLAVTAPRLKPSPRARLFTETMLWQTSAPNIAQYLRAALGGVPQGLYPTLLGLRLLTDPELGPPVPPNLIHMVISDRPDTRRIEWCPAQFPAGGPGSPVPAIPRVPGGLIPVPEAGAAACLGSAVPGLAPVQEDGPPACLATAISRLADTCLISDFNRLLYAFDRSGICFSMGTCLAYVLAAGFGKRWRLETDVSSVAEALLAVISAPLHFRLEWRALAACIAAAEARPESPSAPSGSSDTEAVRAEDRAGRARPGSLPASAPPVFLKGTMATQEAPQREWTDRSGLYQGVPRLLIGSRAAVQRVAGMSHFAIPAALQMGLEVQVLDALDCRVSEDRASLAVQFLLPADHGLALADTWAILTDAIPARSRGCLSYPTSLADFKVAKVRPSCFSQLGDALGLHGPAVQQGSHGGSSDCDPKVPDEMSMALADCRETENEYKVTVSVRCASDPSGVDVKPVLGQSPLSTQRC
jgi:hypothetical protein